jgi:hypothetical protein
VLSGEPKARPPAPARLPKRVARVGARLVTPANAAAWAITLVAAVVVAAWATSPVHRTLQYRLGTAGRGRAELSPNYVPVALSGFAPPEPWGRWTDGPTATVTVGRPLMRAFTLSMTGHAFGPNADAPVRVCAGGECETVEFTGDEAAVEATFHTRRRARRIVIHIPHPTAPGAGDHRLLGIALASIRIEETR